MPMPEYDVSPVRHVSGVSDVATQNPARGPAVRLDSRDKPLHAASEVLAKRRFHYKRPQRTAIIHYWLVGMRGGERVLEQLLKMFPDADIFTHVYNPDAVSDVIRRHKVHTTFIQKMPGSIRHYQRYLPLMPMALEQLDLRGYDLIISSESGPSKGVIVPPGANHICYCHSPMRYIWDQYPDYLRYAGRATRFAMPWLTHFLRSWDFASSARVDHFIANSTFVQRRIQKSYRRDSALVHPPVDTSLFHSSDEVSDRYLWVGQLTGYKRPDIAVEAFNKLGLPLLMVGDGALMRELKAKAKPNVTIAPRLGFDELRHAYATCRGLIFTAEEDFGMVPVEVMASGRPVLAYGVGGCRDTVIPGVNGLFFHEQTVDSLIEGVAQFEAWVPEFNPQDAIRSAERFAPERFEEGIRAAVRAVADL